MKINFLILVLIICFRIAAEENKDSLEQRVPGEYGGYEDICPAGVIIEGFEDEDETEKFEHNVDFFFWLTEKLFGSDNIFKGMSLGITYSKLLEQQSIWEDVVEYELYEGYEAASLLGNPGLNGVWKLNYRLWDHLYIQPEFKYNYHNSELEIEEFPILRHDIPEVNNYLNIEAKLHYISFPLMLRYEFAFRNKIKPYLAIGPSINYFVAGSADWYYSSNLENGGKVFKMQGSIDLENLEGYCLDISGILGLNWSNYFFEIGFESSLTDLKNVKREEYMSDADGEVEEFLLNTYDYRENYISLNVGFHFGK